MLILDYAEVHHRDDCCVAVCEHFDVGQLGTWLLRLLQYLRDTGEVGSGTCVTNGRLKTYEKDK